MRSLLFIAACFLGSLPAPARADFSRFTCAGPTGGLVKVLVHPQHQACRGFLTGTKEVHFSRIASGTLLASKDGRTVVMVEDYLSGGRTGSAIEGDYDVDTIVNPKVLHVYRDGVRVASYDIGRLVKDVKKVTESVSHVRWVETMPSQIGDATFEITTTSGRRITFDSKTGAVVSERSTRAPSQPGPRAPS